MSTMTVPPEVAAYLAAVREALDDLPTAERDDLLAEVEDSLVEAAAEGGGPITARLGRPEDFAAELRSAAGLHEREPARSPAEPRVPLREVVTRVVASDHLQSVRGLVAELAPIWWLARAYVAVAALALLFDSSWSIRHPSVPRIPTAELGLVVIALVVVASVWLGLRTRDGSPRLKQIVLTGNLLLVGALLPVSNHLTEPRTPELIYVAVPSEPLPGLANSGAPVENVYPYSRDGHLLQDVLLYDAAGNPMTVGGDADPSRRVLRTPAGAPLFNSFPIRYFEPGTARVAHPNAGPVVETPTIATPPVTKRPARKARRAR
jgi:hypothetical protein